ncbi:electron transport complex protein RnfD [Lachnospiraceae bacterium RM5]|nr:electron transport complex protein RnfD [Lachnospiraceae bacterium RM5]
MSEKLNISSNPHIRDERSTMSIMLDVIIALLPACIFSVYNFGFRALLVIVVTVMAAVLSEAGYEFILKKKLTISDLSAVVTGLLLALNLPYTIPLWIAVLGSIFAIVVVKMVFGGLGQNFMNPALGARCFLLLSFTSQMTNFVYDGITSSTPLYNVKHGMAFDLFSMFVGREPGTIGETSVIALVIGGLYLLVKRVIDYRIPVFYIGSFTIFAMLYSLATKDFSMRFVLAELFGGGLMLGAWFMATDYVTSPITKKGKIVYGILLGIMTGLFRLVAGDTAAAEGVSYAIIFSNLLVPIIDKYCPVKGFGLERDKNE